jgi:hypothetical protein
MTLENEEGRKEAKKEKSKTKSLSNITYYILKF